MWGPSWLGSLHSSSSAAPQFRFRENFAQALRYALIWAAIALVLVIGYTYRYELMDVSDRVLAELIPGRHGHAGCTVELARRDGGDFQVCHRGQLARGSAWCLIPAQAPSF